MRFFLVLELRVLLNFIVYNVQYVVDHGPKCFLSLSELHYQFYQMLKMSWILADLKVVVVSHLSAVSIDENIVRARHRIYRLQIS